MDVLTGRTNVLYSEVDSEQPKEAVIQLPKWALKMIMKILELNSGEFHVITLVKSGKNIHWSVESKRTVRLATHED